jgi:hypothetical protein
MDNALDAELAWRDFLFDTIGPNNSDMNSQRYIRLNPDLQSNVPSLYAKEELKTLQGRTINILSSSGNQKVIRGIAHRLIASSFYFEKEAPKEVNASETYICSGKFLFIDGHS